MLEGPLTDRVHSKLRVAGLEISLRAWQSFVIGRDASCDLTLDDPLVSRQHARLVISPDGVYLEDLESQNGIYLNGEPLSETVALSPGDSFIIGSQQFFFVAGADESVQSARRPRTTLISQLRPSGADATNQTDALGLLGAVATKMLAAGDGSEAERVLYPQLQRVLQRTKKSGRLRHEVGTQVAGYALRLARMNNNPGWIDYLFELYAAALCAIPAPVVDEIYDLVHKLPRIDVAKVREYLDAMAPLSSRLGPADRFIVQRIAGLVSLAATKR